MSNKSILEESDVRFDRKTGIPKQIRGEFALPVADTDEGSVKAFLSNNAEELKLSAKEEELSLIQAVATSTGHIFRFQQNKDGIPIFATEIVIRLDRDRRIKQIDLEHVLPVKIAAPETDEDQLTAAKAKKAAVDSIGEHTLRREIAKPEQIYYRLAGGLKLAYLVVILSDKPLHDWRIIVDAYTGEILDKEDLLLFAEDGRGFVFDPNPVVTANDNTLRDPTATAATCGFAGTAQNTIDVERVTRDLINITKSGANYKLEGDFVKINNSPIETNKNNFNYSSDDSKFEAVMAYYHIDTIQRYIQNSLGITNAHNSRINVEHHAPQSYASYSSWDDTIRLGHSGDCRPDRGEDGDVMLHEYGHAIQSDQVNSWGGKNPITNRYETKAMGEGFCDILACLFFSEYGGGYQREVFEDWIFASGGPAGSSHTGGGLRRVDGAKVYPWNLASGSGGDWENDWHHDGEIWSAVLWNIYRAIGGDSVMQSDRISARDEVLKTVINSHFRLSGSATMPDGAEAFMDENAELEEYRLINGIDMLDSFHDRGILHCESGSDLKIDALWSQQDDLSVRSWEQVEEGQDNWFYARVRNASTTTTARAFVVTFNFKSPFATPVYPADFRNNTISAAVGFDLAPGAVMTVKARWPKEMIPAIPTGATQRHGCILSEVYNPEDHVAAGVTNIWGSNGKLKQRNTDIVDLLPDETADYFIDVSNYNILRPELTRLEILREAKWQNVEISLNHPNKQFLKELMGRVEFVKPSVVRPIAPTIGVPELRVLERTRVEIAMGTAMQPLTLDLAPGSTMPLPLETMGDEAQDDAFTAPADAEFMRMDADLVAAEESARLAILPGLRVGLPVVMKPRDRAPLNLKVKAPKNAKPGDSFTVVLKQCNKKGELLGELDIKVNVVDKK